MAATDVPESLLEKLKASGFTLDAEGNKIPLPKGDREVQKEPKVEGGTQDVQNDALFKALNDLAERNMSIEVEKPIETDKGDVDFLAGYPGDIDLTNRQVLNKLLNAARTRGAQDAIASLPTIMEARVPHILEVQRATEAFYKKNPDLVPLRSYVRAVAVDLARANPNITGDELYEKTATTVRAAVNLSAKAQEQTQPSSFTPAAPSGARQTPKPKNAFQEQFARMRRI